MQEKLPIILSIYFSYNQFMIFDRSVDLPGCAWTKTHVDQGFARRENCLCVGTLLEFGEADVMVHMGPYDMREPYERVISVPIELSSGEVAIEGPEDDLEGQRFVNMDSGHYRLTAAQLVTGENHEKIDLFFEKLNEPLKASRIVIGDEALHPPSPLLESAEAA